MPGILLRSPAFDDHDNVSPALEWSGVPDTATQLLLMCEDPDAPGGTFLHWLVTDIDPSLTRIAEGQTPPGARSWPNDFDENGWSGPHPPVGNPPAPLRLPPLRFRRTGPAARPPDRHRRPPRRRPHRTRHRHHRRPIPTVTVQGHAGPGEANRHRIRKRRCPLLRLLRPVQAPPGSSMSTGLIAPDRRHHPLTEHHRWGEWLATMQPVAARVTLIRLSAARLPAEVTPMLEIRVEPVSRDEVIVVIRGELDCATSGDLRAAITALLNHGGIAAISLDLRALEFLDSIGVGTLVVAQRICQQVGVHLQVTAASNFATRLLHVLGVDEALGLPAPTDEALINTR